MSRPARSCPCRPASTSARSAGYLSCARRPASGTADHYVETCGLFAGGRSVPGGGLSSAQRSALFCEGNLRFRITGQAGGNVRQRDCHIPNQGLGPGVHHKPGRHHRHHSHSARRRQSRSGEIRRLHPDSGRSRRPAILLHAITVSPRPDAGACRFAGNRQLAGDAESVSVRRRRNRHHPDLFHALPPPPGRAGNPGDDSRQHRGAGRPTPGGPGSDGDGETL